VPHFIIQISPDGPLLDAYVSVSEARLDALQATKQPIPPVQKIRALLDTGASHTCLDPSVLNALAIPPTGTTQINTPSTGHMPHTVHVYDVSMAIPCATSPPLVSSTIAVAGTELLQRLGFHALIGRDILSSCVFHYNGPAKMVTVSY